MEEAIRKDIARVPGTDVSVGFNRPIYVAILGSDSAGLAKVATEFGEKVKKIPGIVDLEWGTNVSPEGLDQGFTHCFLVTFEDVAARDAYLPHPAHVAFGALLQPHLERVLVVDYAARH